MSDAAPTTIKVRVAGLRTSARGIPGSATDAPFTFACKSYVARTNEAELQEGNRFDEFVGDRVRERARRTLNRLAGRVNGIQRRGQHSCYGRGVPQPETTK